MNVGGIDQSRIQAMMAQLKAAATKPAGEIDAAAAPMAPIAPGESTKVDFSQALKNTLDQVSQAQNVANEKSKAFTMGDDSVNLSDVMVSMQKASIAFQATVQVRNKLVSAYHEIMNMQV